MIRKLVKVGDSQAIVLDKALMDQIGLQPDSQVQITADGASLRITPVEVGLGKDRILDHTRAIREQYGDALKRLA